MKKSVVLLITFFLMLSVQVGVVSADSALNEALNSLKGTPYKWGGTSEKGFDCSGFTMHVFKQFDIELPHSSSAQAKKGTAIAKKDLRVGDLVFFNTSGKGISHVGIYIGDGDFIHSATNEGVVVTKVNSKYYEKRFVSARRVLSDEDFERLTMESTEGSLEEPTQGQEQ